MDKHLTMDRSSIIAEKVLLDGKIPEGEVQVGLGMGLEGITVIFGDPGSYIYFDTTFGGDDGYTPHLRTYVTIGDKGDCTGDATWDCTGPTLEASDDLLAGWITGRASAIIQHYAADNNNAR
jgi:hypothetical protein